MNLIWFVAGHPIDLVQGIVYAVPSYFGALAVRRFVLRKAT